LTASKPPATISGHRIGLEEARARIPGPKGQRFAELFAHGSLAVEIYAPRGVDSQLPHTRDEVYVVIQGTGRFAFATERVAFEPGDFLFVPAGVAHRFEDFTDDLIVWVLFYGPEGGEAKRARSGVD